MPSAIACVADSWPDALSPTYQPGDIIADHYRLVSLIAEGGMGSVWIADNLMLELQVALKLIRPELHGQLATERLLREARAAAQLRHPSIVRVFDLGTTERDEPFLVMELLRGESLATRLGRQSPMSSVRTAQLVLPLIEGLAIAHARGMIHRDIKPDNIMLATDDVGRIQPKLVDFGVVKLDEMSPDARAITLSGMLLGSPEYMSPEQARGQTDIDGRTDIWSLCVVMFEMLGGRRPFAGPSHRSILQAIVDSPAPALPGVDEELAAIIRRGMSKDPHERWSCMRQLGQALARWLLTRGIEEDITGASLRAQWLRQDVLEGKLEPVAPCGISVTTAVMDTSARALGDEPYLPPGVSLAAFGAASRRGAKRDSMPSPLTFTPDQQQGRRRRGLTGAVIATALTLVALAVGFQLGARSDGRAAINEPALRAPKSVEAALSRAKPAAKLAERMVVSEPNAQVDAGGDKATAGRPEAGARRGVNRHRAQTAARSLLVIQPAQPLSTQPLKLHGREGHVTEGDKAKQLMPSGL